MATEQIDLLLALNKAEDEYVDALKLVLNKAKKDNRLHHDVVHEIVYKLRLLDIQVDSRDLNLLHKKGGVKMFCKRMINILP